MRWLIKVVFAFNSKTPKLLITIKILCLTVNTHAEIIADAMHNYRRISPDIMYNYTRVYYNIRLYIADLCARMSLVEVYNRR